MNFWTAAQCNKLIELWPQQLSCSEIGAMIGKSKGAVISKRIQLGLPARAKRIRKDRAKSASESSGVLVANNLVNHRLKQLHDLKQTAVGVPMLRLGQRDCHFVLGRGRDRFASCCGHPVTYRSYCEEHVRMCYIKK